MVSAQFDEPAKQRIISFPRQQAGSRGMRGGLSLRAVWQEVIAESRNEMIAT